ncbi:hypothetical protein L1887_02738 [Cichorium endivia]|nr:hypothetical protein L1887_02738 [Cichorium endivia]
MRAAATLADPALPLLPSASLQISCLLALSSLVHPPLHCILFSRTMAETQNTDPKTTYKAYVITNIKSYVPLILDLSTRNYEPWSDLFTAHCIAYDGMDHIDDSYDQPKTPPTDPEWGKIDKMVKLWLFGTISQNIITSAYSNNATARKVWLNIHAIFYDNTESTAMQLETEIRNITLGDLSIHAYFDKIKKLADLLEGLVEKLKERTIVTHALNGLPSKFDSIANIIRYTKPFPYLSETRSMLSMEEIRLGASRPSNLSHDHHASSPALLHVGTPSGSAAAGNRGGGGNTSRGGGGGSNNHRGDIITRNAGNFLPDLLPPETQPTAGFLYCLHRTCLLMLGPPPI